MGVLDVLSSEIPNYSSDVADSSFAELGLDSFDLLSLRLALETRIGTAIPDPVWSRIRTPAEAASACAAHRAGASTGSRSEGLEGERSYTIGMPQMALSGLSERWLLQELGDFHWDLIMRGLGTSSGALRDGNGDRLYATFTRIRYESTHPFSAFAENERLTLEGSLRRQGAGVFLGEFVLRGDGKEIAATLMSSFSRRAGADSGNDLVKGQPVIPDDCRIGELDGHVPFIDEYRQRRKESGEASLFDCPYRLNPYTDINGVGLLYFAAFPTISDTCELLFRDEGNGWAERASPIARDISYFANCDLDEELRFDVLADISGPDEASTETTLSRSSDGRRMCRISTRKQLRK